MPKSVKRRGVSLEANRRRSGYTFIAHWLIGLIMFMIIPIFNSIQYAFSDVEITVGSIETDFAGLKYFKEILVSDPTYLDNVVESLQELVYTLPIILTVSLVLAVLLNQKFPGRTVFRAIFFLPVIIVETGLLGAMSSSHIINGAVTSIQSGAESAYGSIIDFEAILSSLSMPSAITNFIAEYLSKVFNLIFDCGVQTILFLSGMQSVDPALYEVSKIEGATKWEEFWFVTIPMLRHIIMLVLVYTMIECCANNPAMTQAFTNLSSYQRYSLSSAMTWFYFALAAIVMGIVIGVYNRFCMKRWD